MYLRYNLLPGDGVHCHIGTTLNHPAVRILWGLMDDRLPNWDQKPAISILPVEIPQSQALELMVLVGNDIADFVCP